MNIMLLADLVVKSGVGKYIYSLASHYKRSGDNVIVVSANIQLDIEGELDVKCYKVNTVSKRPLQLIKAVRSLRKLIKANRVDIVHINHRMSGMIMRLYNTIYFWDKIPSVWTVHTAPFPGGRMMAMMTYHGNYAIAISEEVADFCRNSLKIKDKDIIKLLNGVDDSELTALSSEEIAAIKSKHSIPNDRLVIAMHGRIDVVKGIDLVVEAIAQLPPDIRNKVTVVCSGMPNGDYYDSIISSINSYNIADSFRFMGWVKSNQILGISDLVILPSRREGFALAAIEAYIMRVPLVRTRLGGYIDTQEYCRAIDTDNVEQIVDVITEFVGSSNMYDGVVCKAYDFAINNCTLSHMADKTKQAYIKAVGNVR